MANEKKKKTAPAALEDDVLDVVVGGVAKEGATPLVQIEDPDSIDPSDTADGYALSPKSNFMEK